MRDHARNAVSNAHDGVGMSRRAFMRRSGTAGLGAAAVWSVPSIRTTVLGPGATGTPSPETRTQSESTPPGSGSVAPTDTSVTPVAATPGRLPMTGTDPRGLLVAGGAAIVAGGALLSVSRDPEPVRQQD